MAVFKLNVCKFNNCELMFNNLENLIRHIETNHINYDPKIIEQFETQQPTCLPLSYVLKFFADLPPSNEEKLNIGNSKLKQTLLSPRLNAQQTNSSCNENVTAQQEVQNDSESTSAEEKSESWVAVKTNSRIFKNVKVKKSYKCHCGKTYGTSPSLRKHAAQCSNAAVLTAQAKDMLQQKEAELSGNVNNNNNNSVNNNNLVSQHYSSSIALKQISASPGTSLKTLVVSSKSPNTADTVQGVPQTIQQPQRLMIQLTELNTITA